MKIGYPGTNLSVDCTPSSTFRLASYSPERFYQTLSKNLTCLEKILRFNARNGITFYRIASDLVPFASHPVCTENWAEHFAGELDKLGMIIRAQGVRIAMHPGQFTLINSPDEDIFRRAVAELVYHARLMESLGLDTTHKIQIHVGGVYGDKKASMDRFAERFPLLPKNVRERLVIENDDKLYSLDDCLVLHERVGIPIVFDVLHNELLGNLDEPVCSALARAARTWSDTLPMIDYSSQDPAKRAGSHAPSLDVGHFLAFVNAVQGFEFDMMIEIKDKEQSVLRAMDVLRVPNISKPVPPLQQHAAVAS
jgi:UV DNA damage endonuclease